jgi:hypothetical protein
MSNYATEKKIQRYAWLLGKKKELQCQLLEIKKEEVFLQKEIQNYLVENGESGIRVDAQTILKIQERSRNTRVPFSKQKEGIQEILRREGIYSDKIIDEILNLKKGESKQQNFLKIEKI